MRPFWTTFTAGRGPTDLNFVRRDGSVSAFRNVGSGDTQLTKLAYKYGWYSRTDRWRLVPSESQ